MIIRDAAIADIPAVCELYNALIPTTTIAWSELLQSIDERHAWFANQQQRDHPVLVAVDDEAVIGFASYGSFRGEGRWPGYRFTVEHTIHVAEAHWGTGVGRALLEALIERARAAGMHVMVGAIDGDNDASLRFHERLGFTTVAVMPQTGRKFDRWLTSSSSNASSRTIHDGATGVARRGSRWRRRPLPTRTPARRPRRCIRSPA